MPWGQHATLQGHVLQQPPHGQPLVNSQRLTCERGAMMDQPLHGS